jgi:hypothetical protein
LARPASFFEFPPLFGGMVVIWQVNSGQLKDVEVIGAHVHVLRQ